MRGLIAVAVCSLAVGLAAADPPAECPPFWTQFDQSCYRVLGEHKNWHDAEADCIKLSPSGRTAHLVSIGNIYENQFVHALSSESVGACTDHIWLGASDQQVEGQFQWTDNSGNFNDFTNWKDGEPNNDHHGEEENCLHMYEAYQTWNDTPCKDVYSYVCEAPAA